MNIALDMMGGDFAPEQAMKGVQLYLSDSVSPAFLFLIGKESQLAALLEQDQIPSHLVKLVHASQFIDMHEHPTKALKEIQNTSKRR